jgi:hypothetical protein
LISSPPGTEMFQFPGLPPRCLCVQQRVSRYQPGGVAPFGHPRITARRQLPAAFRSHPRPSSALGAKASTVRPFSLGYSIRSSLRVGRILLDQDRPTHARGQDDSLSPLTHLHYSAVVQVHLCRLIACRRAHRPSGPCSRPQPASPVTPSGATKIRLTLCSSDGTFRLNRRGPSPSRWTCQLSRVSLL